MKVTKFKQRHANSGNSSVGGQPVGLSSIDVVYTVIQVKKRKKDKKKTQHPRDFGIMSRSQNVVWT